MRERIPWIAALATLALHLIGNAHYGFFRDELYFIECGFHPQFGYVDQPPVVPLLAALTQALGHSLFFLRAVPALCAAAGAWATVRLVIEFGGGSFAQTLATIAYLGAPVLTSFGAKVGPDEIGLWTWPLIALWLVQLERGADPRTWLALGAVAGVSLESKYTALFFFVALVAGLLATPQRRILRSRWALGGILIGAAIAAPNFVWQATNGFPMWELLEAGQHGKNVIAGPVVYLVQEVAITNFYLAPLWIAGVVWLLREARYRFLGIAYLVLIGEMIVLHGKHYYPADVYPIVIAAGATAFAGLAAWRATRIALAAYAVVYAALSIPTVLPILDENALVGYERALRPLSPLPEGALATEHSTAPAIGSDYGDMHGWPELASAVRAAYDSLPSNERAHTVILATNYGDASALRFFAPDLPTISTHNQYWLWGYGSSSGETILEVGGSCWKSDHFFTSSRVIAPYVTTLHECTGLRVPMQRLWSESKNYS